MRSTHRIGAERDLVGLGRRALFATEAERGRVVALGVRLVPGSQAEAPARVVARAADDGRKPPRHGIQESTRDGGIVRQRQVLVATRYRGIRAVDGVLEAAADEAVLLRDGVLVATRHHREEQRGIWRPENSCKGGATWQAVSWTGIAVLRTQLGWQFSGELRSEKESALRHARTRVSVLVELIRGASDGHQKGGKHHLHLSSPPVQGRIEEQPVMSCFTCTFLVSS
jgi:hypothetical protein